MPRWLLFASVTILMYGVFGFLAGLNDAQDPAPHFWVTSSLMTIGVIPTLLVPAMMRGAWSGQNPRRGAIFALLTGLVGGVTNIGTYAALQSGGPISIVIPLTAAYPIAAALMAIVFLRERINFIQAIGIAVGVTGAIMLSTSGDAGGAKTVLEQLKHAITQPWFWWTMDTLLGQAVIGILGKLSTNDLAPEGSFVLFCVTFCLFALGIFFVQRNNVSWSIGAKSWLLILSLGLVTGIGVLFQLMALRVGNAGIVTALTGMYPLVTTLLAVIFLSAPITLKIAAGTVLVLAGASAMSFETPPATDAEGSLDVVGAASGKQES